MASRYRLPLIPSPNGDETFGSWLHRCAAAYHTTVGGFANSVLAMHGAPPITTYVDWDTEPPDRLLSALAAHSGILRSELEYLMVPRGPATLPKAFRDTYCPMCFAEDLIEGVIYFRKAWLDAWTLHCPVHSCLLGRFSAFEYRQSQTTTHFPQGLRRARDTDRVVKSNPTVRRAPLNELVCESTSAGGRPLYKAQPWFDQRMLRSMVGRDLMMVAGSEDAQCLHHALFGFFRPPQYLWQGKDNKSVCWPNAQHPIASIDVRIHAAYVASLLWHCLQGTEWSRAYWRLTAHAMHSTLNALSVRGPMSGITRRWSSTQRKRWCDAFDRPMAAYSPELETDLA